MAENQYNAGQYPSQYGGDPGGQQSSTSSQGPSPEMLPCPVSTCGAPGHNSFDSFDALCTHWRMCHDLATQIYNCPLCGWMGMLRDALISHLVVVHDVFYNESLESGMCNSTFQHPGQYFPPNGYNEWAICSLWPGFVTGNSHLRPLTWKGEAMGCPVKGCSSTRKNVVWFKTLQDLKSHWYEVHEPKCKVYKCSLCPANLRFSAKYLKTMQGHLMNVHRDAMKQGTPEQYVLEAEAVNWMCKDPSPYYYESVPIELIMNRSSHQSYACVGMSQSPLLGGQDCPRNSPSDSGLDQQPLSTALMQMLNKRKNVSYPSLPSYQEHISQVAVPSCSSSTSMQFANLMDVQQLQNQKSPHVVAVLKDMITRQQSESEIKSPELSSCRFQQTASSYLSGAQDQSVPDCDVSGFAIAREMLSLSGLSQGNSDFSSSATQPEQSTTTQMQKPPSPIKTPPHPGPWKTPEEMSSLNDGNEDWVLDPLSGLFIPRDCAVDMERTVDMEGTVDIEPAVDMERTAEPSEPSLKTSAGVISNPSSSDPNLTADVQNVGQSSSAVESEADLVVNDERSCLTHELTSLAISADEGCRTSDSTPMSNSLNTELNSTVSTVLLTSQTAENETPSRAATTSPVPRSCLKKSEVTQNQVETIVIDEDEEEENQAQSTSNPTAVSDDALCHLAKLTNIAQNPVASSGSTSTVYPTSSVFKTRPDVSNPNVTPSSQSSSQLNTQISTDVAPSGQPLSSSTLAAIRLGMLSASGARDNEPDTIMIEEDGGQASPKKPPVSKNSSIGLEPQPNLSIRQENERNADVYLPNLDLALSSNSTRRIEPSGSNITTTPHAVISRLVEAMMVDLKADKGTVVPSRVPTGVPNAAMRATRPPGIPQGQNVFQNQNVFQSQSIASMPPLQSVGPVDASVQFTLYDVYTGRHFAWLPGSCPVSQCVGKVISNPWELALHWQEFHLSTWLYYLCPACSGSQYRTANFAVYCEHLVSSHISQTGEIEHQKAWDELWAATIVHEVTNAANCFVDPRNLRLAFYQNVSRCERGIAQLKEEYMKALPLIHGEDHTIINTLTMQEFERRSFCPVNNCVQQSHQSFSDLVCHWKRIHGRIRTVYTCPACHNVHRCRKYFEDPNKFWEHILERHIKVLWTSYRNKAMHVLWRAVWQSSELSPGYINPGHYQLFELPLGKGVFPPGQNPGACQETTVPVGPKNSGKNTGLRRFHCPAFSCPARCSTLCSLTDHVESHHLPYITSFTCTACGVKKHSLGSMKHHHRTSQGCGDQVEKKISRNPTYKKCPFQSMSDPMIVAIGKLCRKEQGQLLTGPGVVLPKAELDERVKVFMGLASRKIDAPQQQQQQQQPSREIGSISFCNAPSSSPPPPPPRPYSPDKEDEEQREIAEGLQTSFDDDCQNDDDDDVDDGICVDTGVDSGHSSSEEDIIITDYKAGRTRRENTRVSNDARKEILAQLQKGNDSAQTNISQTSSDLSQGQSPAGGRKYAKYYKNAMALLKEVNHSPKQATVSTNEKTGLKEPTPVVVLSKLNLGDKVTSVAVDKVTEQLTPVRPSGGPASPTVQTRTSETGRKEMARTTPRRGPCQMLAESDKWKVSSPPMKFPKIKLTKCNVASPSTAKDKGLGEKEIDEPKDSMKTVKGKKKVVEDTSHKGVNNQESPRRSTRSESTKVESTRTETRTESTRADSTKAETRAESTQAESSRTETRTESSRAVLDSRIDEHKKALLKSPVVKLMDLTKTPEKLAVLRKPVVALDILDDSQLTSVKSKFIDQSTKSPKLSSKDDLDVKSKGSVAVLSSKGSPHKSDLLLKQDLIVSLPKLKLDLNAKGYAHMRPDVVVSLPKLKLVDLNAKGNETVVLSPPLKSPSKKSVIKPSDIENSPSLSISLTRCDNLLNTKNTVNLSPAGSNVSKSKVTPNHSTPKGRPGPLSSKSCTKDTKGSSQDKMAEETRSVTSQQQDGVRSENQCKPFKGRKKKLVSFVAVEFSVRKPCPIFNCSFIMMDKDSWYRHWQERHVWQSNYFACPYCPWICSLKHGLKLARKHVALHGEKRGSPEPKSVSVDKTLYIEPVMQGSQNQHDDHKEAENNEKDTHENTDVAENKSGRAKKRQGAPRKSSAGDSTDKNDNITNKKKNGAENKNANNANNSENVDDDSADDESTGDNNIGDDESVGDDGVCDDGDDTFIDDDNGMDEEEPVDADVAADSDDDNEIGEEDADTAPADTAPTDTAPTDTAPADMAPADMASERRETRNSKGTKEIVLAEDGEDTAVLLQTVEAPSATMGKDTMKIKFKHVRWEKGMRCPIEGCVWRFVHQNDFMRHWNLYHIEKIPAIECLYCEENYSPDEAYYDFKKHLEDSHRKQMTKSGDDIKTLIGKAKKIIVNNDKYVKPLVNKDYEVAVPWDKNDDEEEEVMDINDEDDEPDMTVAEQAKGKAGRKRKAANDKTSKSKKRRTSRRKDDSDDEVDDDSEDDDSLPENGVSDDSDIDESAPPKKRPEPGRRSSRSSKKRVELAEDDDNDEEMDVDGKDAESDTPAKKSPRAARKTSKSPSQARDGGSQFHKGDGDTKTSNKDSEDEDAPEKDDESDDEAEQTSRRTPARTPRGRKKSVTPARDEPQGVVRKGLPKKNKKASRIVSRPNKAKKIQSVSADSGDESDASAKKTEKKGARTPRAAGRPSKAVKISKSVGSDSEDSDAPAPKKRSAKTPSKAKGRSKVSDATLCKQFGLTGLGPMVHLCKLRANDITRAKENLSKGKEAGLPEAIPTLPDRLLNVDPRKVVPMSKAGALAFRAWLEKMTSVVDHIGRIVDKWDAEPPPPTVSAASAAKDISVQFEKMDSDAEEENDITNVCNSFLATEDPDEDAAAKTDADKTTEKADEINSKAADEEQDGEAKSESKNKETSENSVDSAKDESKKSSENSVDDDIKDKTETCPENSEKDTSDKVENPEKDVSESDKVERKESEKAENEKSDKVELPESVLSDSVEKDSAEKDKVEEMETIVNGPEAEPDQKGDSLDSEPEKMDTSENDTKLTSAQDSASPKKTNGDPETVTNATNESTES